MPIKVSSKSIKPYFYVVLYDESTGHVLSNQYALPSTLWNVLKKEKVVFTRKMHLFLKASNSLKFYSEYIATIDLFFKLDDYKKEECLETCDQCIPSVLSHKLFLNNSNKKVAQKFILTQIDIPKSVVQHNLYRKILKDYFHINEICFYGKNYPLHSF